jgi:protease I
MKKLLAGDKKMSKIACLIERDFEDSEYSDPADSFEKAGHEIIHIGFKKGEEVKGKHHKASAVIDKSVPDVSSEEFDALFIPGGYSPDRLRVDDHVVEFVKRFANSGKPIFAICHGPQLLITAQILKGKNITGWKSIKQDIINSGATYLDQEVVRDGNLVSSRKPDDIPAFVSECLKVLDEFSAMRKAA